MNRRTLLCWCMLIAISLFFSGTLFQSGTAASTNRNLDAVVEKLKSPQAEQRASAIAAIGNMGPKAAPAIKQLILLLEDRHTIKRRDGEYTVETDIMTETKKALIKIGPASVSPLLKTFGDKNVHWVVRSNAAEVLGALHDSRAIEPLIEFLKNKDDKVWDEAGFVADRTKTALEEITGQSYAKTGNSFGQDYRKWREWFDSSRNKK